jgi:prepilin-type N-terminal cleavage/methylation domain-containing protein
MNSLKTRGFTLIELLVVIAIIGILAAVVLANMGDARKQAEVSVAKQQLNQLHIGIFKLHMDTGRGPNGCFFGRTANPEVALNQPTAGLVSVPPVGVVEGTCAWTAHAVSQWRGPYFRETEDPWGYSYYLDPDYIPWQQCPDKATEPVIYAIVSLGPDRAWYSCDDIFLKIN